MLQYSLDRAHLGLFLLQEIGERFKGFTGFQPRSTECLCRIVCVVSGELVVTARTTYSLNVCIVNCNKCH